MSELQGFVVPRLERLTQEAALTGALYNKLRGLFPEQVEEVMAYEGIIFAPGWLADIFCGEGPDLETAGLDGAPLGDHLRLEFWVAGGSPHLETNEDKLMEVKVAPNGVSVQEEADQAPTLLRFEDLQKIQVDFNALAVAMAGVSPRPYPG